MTCHAHRLPMNICYSWSHLETLPQLNMWWGLEALIHHVTASLAYNNPALLELLSRQVTFGTSYFYTDTFVWLHMTSNSRTSTAFYKWDWQLREMPCSQLMQSGKNDSNWRKGSWKHYTGGWQWLKLVWGGWNWRKCIKQRAWAGRERCGRGASVAQTVRVLAVHMQMSHWLTWLRVSSFASAAHTGLDISCFFSLQRPLNMQTDAGWYEKPRPLYLFLLFFFPLLDQICESYTC